MRNYIFSFLLLANLISTPVHALDASDFSDLVGWTVLNSTQVDGDFEGCDFDKQIQLMNGWALTCNTFSYSYSFMPEAVIFVKSMEYKGKKYWMIKALIDDDLYDMEPILAR